MKQLPPDTIAAPAVAAAALPSGPAAASTPGAAASTDAGASAGAAASTGARWRFLLAEDNPVNRTLGSRLLVRYGHDVVCVENGREAVETCERERFDVILMDVEMPVMNGFEATAAIREQERLRSGRRTPIIALTAHAMQGDRARCLDAAMDDYATKPIQPAELFATITALLDANPPEATMTTPVTTDVPVLDRTALYEQVGDEADLLLKVIEMFRADSIQVIAKLDAALAAQDASEVQQGAHRLKGALLTLGAKPAANVAMQLEHMGRDGDVSSGAPLLVVLRAELARLDPELDDVVSSLEIPAAANL